MSKDQQNIESQLRIRQILEDLSEDERKLLSAVIDAERDKLYMQRPRGINEELWKALTGVIR